jgi:hypothetical protein
LLKTLSSWSWLRMEPLIFLPFFELHTFWNLFPWLGKTII